MSRTGDNARRCRRPTHTARVIDQTPRHHDRRLHPFVFMGQVDIRASSASAGPPPDALTHFFLDGARAGRMHLSGRADWWLPALAGPPPSAT